MRLPTLKAPRLRRGDTVGIVSPSSGITDMDFGHTSPQLTLPIGCRARIDAAGRTLEVVESAVL